MRVPRNDIMEALKALIVARAFFMTVSRRLKLWTECPAAMQPACYFAEHGETRARQSETLPKDSFTFDLFIYTKAPNPDDVPASILNLALDALDAAIAPSTATDKLANKQTLGGLVSHCYIDGVVMKDPGDLDGQGVAVVPIKILVP